MFRTLQRNHGSALNAFESSSSLPLHGCRASVLSSKQQRRQPLPSKASSQRSLLGNPRSVSPLAMLRSIVVQDVPDCGATLHYSAHQLPPPSLSNHSTRGSLVASPQCVPPLAMTFVSVVQVVFPIR
ncbi:hypothetical protein HN51_002089 [Arachis hypogaea]